MASRIIMPKQGLQMTEGLILRWLAKEGDPVREGEPLFEMETDKLTITIDSSATGTLLKILKGEGEMVPITETIAIVGEAGEDISGLLDKADAKASEQSRAQTASPAHTETAKAPVQENGQTRIFATPRARMHAEERSIDLNSIEGSGPDGLIIDRDVPEKTSATPLARREAELAGLELTGLSGTGPHGKILAQDVRAAVPVAVQSDDSPEETVVPLTGMRRIIARRMKESLAEMAQANHRMEVDMSEAARVREQLKAAQIRVSYNDLILRCVARALQEHPRVNARMTADAIIESRRVHLGMAVATDTGLLVPVIRDADRKTLPQIGEEARDLGKRAREGGLKPDEMTGATFTVTNLGMFGVDAFTPIVNAPEAGILGVGQIRKRPVVVDDAIVIRPMMWLSLSYDHRIVDGAPAAMFLGRVRELLEHPTLLL